MKISLPVFKDEDIKNAVMYQSYCWDLTVYHHTGCQDCILLPYAIHSLQGYPGEWVRSSGTDITRDDILTILDEHYNNVKALDALNQELFQLHMGEKETGSDWGVCLSRHLQVLTVSFPECFPQTTQLKYYHFYGGLLKWLKAMVAYLKASTNKKTYSDYLWAVTEAEKEEVMELSHSQMAENPTKPKAMSFFPLQKLKDSQPTKTPTVHVAYLEEEGSNKGGTESDDPNAIEGVTEEFIVCLPRAVKEIQQDEKCCYHCSRAEHLICKCPSVKASRTANHLN